MISTATRQRALDLYAGGEDRLEAIAGATGVSTTTLRDWMARGIPAPWAEARLQVAQAKERGLVLQLEEHLSATLQANPAGKLTPAELRDAAAALVDLQRARREACTAPAPGKSPQSRADQPAGD